MGVTATIKTAKDGDPVLRTAHDVVRGQGNVAGGQDLGIEKGVGAVKDPRNSHQVIERSKEITIRKKRVLNRKRKNPHPKKQSSSNREVKRDYDQEEKGFEQKKEKSPPKESVNTETQDMDISNSP